MAARSAVGLYPARAVLQTADPSASEYFPGPGQAEHDVA
eukprot:CAMPEP_0182482762 /NCGR_PEP_ID=MMETSP1319-20130603/39899_1 /TAXON_ID=172717 /ORGANISM="Bolidomonas pacifica, Strain RCC208" /LENGTH=38 /DNA_ID= /DNA_START= /DNA_END= /DNA_ORIENTATION=